MAFEAKYDVIILGGGPAGMSAAAWCSDLNLRSIVIEGDRELGGQLLRIFAPVKNYPGVETQSGQEMRDRFLESLTNGKSDLRSGETPISIDLSKKQIGFSTGDEIRAEALIIATGVRRRKLCVEGEDEFAGRGILTSGAKEKELVKGANVVIVGGGDAALENALILSDYAKHVTVVHRRNRLSARSEFVSEANAKPNIEFKFSSTVRSFIGTERLAGVEIELEDGSVSTIDASFALIRIGVHPNSDIFQNQLKLDLKGYIEISPNCQTSCSGVYAIGDVAFPISPTIATAVGSAAIACKNLLATFEKINNGSRR